MAKALTLLLTILLATASLGGYVYLDAKINEGQKKISAGEKQIAEGEQQLRAGQNRLAAGKKKLSAGKNQYNTMKMIPFSQLQHVIPEGKPVFDLAQQRLDAGRQEIAAGEKQVAAGAEKIQAGKARLQAGKDALKKGKMQLAFAKQIRLACGISAGFFGGLTFVLAVFWRRKRLMTPHGPQKSIT